MNNNINIVRRIIEEKNTDEFTVNDIKEYFNISSRQLGEILKSLSETKYNKKFGRTKPNYVLEKVNKNNTNCYTYKVSDFTIDFLKPKIPQ